MISSQTFATTPGMSSFFNPVLTGVYILAVKREGLGFTETTGAPGSGEFKNTAGIILFNAVFAAGEKVWVLFEN